VNPQSHGESDRDYGDDPSDQRASIARGQALFNSKPIQITNVAGLNDDLNLAILPGTCGTCHDSPNAGNHSVSAPLNIGVGDLNSPLDVSYLPVITLTCSARGTIHPESAKPGPGVELFPASRHQRAKRIDRPGVDGTLPMMTTTGTLAPRVTSLGICAFT
jgi:hypothetical protein